MKGFFRICNYYMKFVKGFSQLVVSLTYLTKKGAFKWLEDAQVEFNRMKRVMNTFPVLSLPDFMHPFVMECDASDDGIGVVLM